MKKYIPWVDTALFGGMALLGVVSTALTWFVWVDNAIVGKIILSVVSSAFVAVATVVLYKKYRSRPDYVDAEFGVAVWSGGISYFSGSAGKSALRGALKYFVRELPLIIKGTLPRGFVEHQITEGELRHMLQGARIEWCSKPITITSRWGWTMKDNAGLQKSKGVMVHWQNTIAQSALFHELQHMVDELLLNRYDANHQNREWWKLTNKLKQGAGSSGATL